MRGLVMDFPSDLAARDINDEYLFGKALLVAPVHDYKARSRQVYLPSGADWYAFNTGQFLHGGQSVSADAPLRRMPIFVRAGAILPIGPALQYTGEHPATPITLYVYAGANGSFSLYEDDGLTNGYARGAFSRIPITYDDKTGALVIGARQGQFPGMLTRRTFNIRWIVPTKPAALDFSAPADRTVTYSGQAVVVHR